MRYELDEVSFKIVHVVPEVAARLYVRVIGLLLILTWYEVHKRRMAEISDACCSRIIIL